MTSVTFNPYAGYVTGVRVLELLSGLLGSRVGGRYVPYLGDSYHSITHYKGGIMEALQRLYRAVIDPPVFSEYRCQSHASPQVFTQ
jgi:hypothetical protein